MTNQTTTQPPNPWWALDILVIGLLAMYAFAGFAVTPFHGDESMQIFMSHDYAYLFQDGNVQTLLYTEDKRERLDVEQGLRIINGTVNKFTIGIAWDAAGFTREELNWPWYWDESYQWNMDNGFYPGDDLLLASRIPSSLFLSAAVITMFFVAKVLAGRPAGYMAATYLALNPGVLVNGRRAMMEGSLLFGATLVVLGGLWLVRAKLEWRSWAAAATVALGAGFAVASKHTNVVAVASVFIGCGLYAVVLLRQEQTKRGIRMLVQLILAGVVSVALFYLLNPSYWENPVTVARVVLDERVTLLDGQIDVFGGYAHFGEKLLGFYRQTFETKPMYAETNSFAAAMEVQGYNYEQTPYAGIHLPGVGLPLLAAFILGCGVLFGVLHLRDVEPGTRWVIGTYVILTTAFCLFAVPLEWQRYYLPMAPVVAAIAPLGILWVVRLFLRDARANAPVYRRGSARVQRNAS
jgi:hypothetical protein